MKFLLVIIHLPNLEIIKSTFKKLFSKMMMIVVKDLLPDKNQIRDYNLKNNFNNDYLSFIKKSLYLYL